MGKLQARNEILHKTVRVESLRRMWLDSVSCPQVMEEFWFVFPRIPVIPYERFNFEWWASAKGNWQLFRLVSYMSAHQARVSFAPGFFELPKTGNPSANQQNNVHPIYSTTAIFMFRFAVSLLASYRERQLLITRRTIRATKPFSDVRPFAESSICKYHPYEAVMERKKSSQWLQWL